VSVHSEKPTLVVIEQQWFPYELLGELLDLSVLELDDLLLRWLSMPQSAASNMCPSWIRKAVSGGGNQPVSGSKR